MKIKCEVTLLDGRTNSSDGDTESSAPIELMLGQAVADAADLLATKYNEDGEEIRGEDGYVQRDDEKFESLIKEITAKTRARETDKWSRDITGTLYRNGRIIGHFEASTSYRFD